MRLFHGEMLGHPSFNTWCMMFSRGRFNRSISLMELINSDTFQTFYYLSAYAQPVESPCATKNCSSLPYSFCKMVKSKPTCTCPEACNTTLRPVCGSDGATYLNLCLLKRTSCKREKLVTIKSKGYCPGNVSCTSNKSNGSYLTWIQTCTQI